MLHSMTGFGRGEAVGLGRKITVELKSVNHRYIEVYLRTPKQLSFLEERARRFITGSLARGRIDGFIALEQLEEKAYKVKVDKALASSYYKAMNELLAELEAPGGVKNDYIFSIPGVLAIEESETDYEEYWPVFEQALNAALNQMLGMRESEGEKLKDDLSARIGRVKEIVDMISSRSPQVTEDYRVRLMQRLQEWLESSVLDMDRVTAETVIFAEKSSIAEEITRLGIHFGHFVSTIKDGGPVGRKLDFIIQEMNREVNTISSKSSDAEISSMVVDAKSELEKIREQVQNVE